MGLGRLTKNELVPDNHHRRPSHGGHGSFRFRLSRCRGREGCPEADSGIPYRFFKLSQQVEKCRARAFQALRYRDLFDAAGCTGLERHVGILSRHLPSSVNFMLTVWQKREGFLVRAAKISVPGGAVSGAGCGSLRKIRLPDDQVSDCLYGIFVRDHRPYIQHMTVWIADMRRPGHPARFGV